MVDPLAFFTGPTSYAIGNDLDVDDVDDDRRGRRCWRRGCGWGSVPAVAEDGQHHAQQAETAHHQGRQHGRLRAHVTARSSRSAGNRRFMASTRPLSTLGIYLGPIGDPTHRLSAGFTPDAEPPTRSPDARKPRQAVHHRGARTRSQRSVASFRDRSECHRRSAGPCTRDPTGTERPISGAWRTV